MSLYMRAREGDADAIRAALTTSDSPAVRRRAAELLGEVADLDDQQTVDKLVRAAREDDDEGVRAAAIDALDAIGQPAVEQLVAATADVSLDGPDRAVAKTFARTLSAKLPELRIASANVLGRVGDEKVVPALVARLDDPDRRVRLRVCHACGRLGDPRTVPKLTARLGDCDPSVKQAAADALGQIATDRALEALLGLLGDDSASIRRVAASALGNASDARPVAHLAEALGDESGPVRQAAVFSIVELLSNAPAEQSHRVREAVVAELSDADDGTVLAPLVEILSDSVQLRQRRNAAWFLGRVCGDDPPRPVVAGLVAALDDDDRMTAQFAATSLAAIGGRDVEDALLDVLDGPASADARAKVAFVLGDVGGDRSRERLERLVDGTEDKAVRKRAFAALSKLGGTGGVAR